MKQGTITKVAMALFEALAPDYSEEEKVRYAKHCHMVTEHTNPRRIRYRAGEVSLSGRAKSVELQATFHGKTTYAFHPPLQTLEAEIIFAILDCYKTGTGISHIVLEEVTKDGIQLAIREVSIKELMRIIVPDVILLKDSNARVTLEFEDKYLQLGGTGDVAMRRVYFRE